MRQKSVHPKSSSERIVKNIRRATRKRHSPEEKIRIVLDGLRGETSIAELCRREGIAESLYYTWSKEFLEAGKRRLAGDTARAATSGEVKDLRREAQELKAVVAEQALELRLLKKSMIADGENGGSGHTPPPRSWRSSGWSRNPICRCAARWISLGCQSALDRDPRSASKRDPLERRVLAVALAPSELVGVAETARARAA